MFKGNCVTGLGTSGPICCVYLSILVSFGCATVVSLINDFSARFFCLIQAFVMLLYGLHASWILDSQFLHYTGRGGMDRGCETVQERAADILECLHGQGVTKLTMLESNEISSSLVVLGCQNYQKYVLL